MFKMVFKMHDFILIPLISNVISFGLSFEYKEGEFTERPDCRYKHLRSGIDTSESTADSVIGCARQCSTLSGCLTFSYAQNDCRLHKGILDNTCGSYDTHLEAKAYEKILQTCQNGGTPMNDTCICSGGYVGQNCQRLATECGELLQYPWYPKAELIVQIQPSLNIDPITIVCDLDILNPVTNKARNYVQKHHQLGVTFNRLWDDYKNGFGDLSQKEYWIGNEAIHQLTSSFPSSTLVIEMASENWLHIWQQTYEGFRVGDEASEYLMTYTSTSPYPLNSGMGDSLIQVNNTMFCTADHNNNIDPNVNCGTVRQSGFWLCDPGNKCGHGNPNGQLMKTGNGEIIYVYHEVFWNTLNVGTTSPWFVQMWLEF